MSAYSKKTTAPRTNRFHPEVQALEDRQLLSVSSTFFGGVLKLTGNSNADVVSATHDGNGRVTYSATGIRQTQQSGVNKLVIDTGDGRDTVRFTQSGSLLRSFDLDVRLGDGADNFVGALQGAISSGRTMNINVNGGGESDLITMNAFQNADVQRGARLVVNLATGTGITDKTTFDYRGKMEGTLDINMSGNRGENTLGAFVGLNAGSTGQVNGQVDGDRGEDRLTFLVSDFSGASINALMNGGAQKDVGAHTTNVRTSEVETNNVVNFQ